MKKILITGTLIIIILTGALLWWKNALNPVNSKNKNSQIFVVHQGEGIRGIAKTLHDQDLIKDQVAFFLLTKKLGLDKKIEAGDYRLSPSMSANEIALDLTHGILDIWVTIPEGNRALEIADILKSNIPSYEDSWKTQLSENEGYLFPDTYLIPRDASIDLIIKTMRDNFDSKYASLNTSNTKLNQNQIVTIASLVEREAKTDRDRPLVASVILNRLDIGMKLDLDATIQYALGYQTSDQRWWKKSLTISDLGIDSPYNTYTTAGLPPTPISNPGLASLNAVVNPANTNYLYYISDSLGNNHYAKTLSEQNANIKKYGL